MALFKKLPILIWIMEKLLKKKEKVAVFKDLSILGYQIFLEILVKDLSNTHYYEAPLRKDKYF